MTPVWCPQCPLVSGDPDDPGQYQVPQPLTQPPDPNSYQDTRSQNLSSVDLVVPGKKHILFNFFITPPSEERARGVIPKSMDGRTWSPIKFPKSEKKNI